MCSQIASHFTYVWGLGKVMQGVLRMLQWHTLLLVLLLGCYVITTISPTSTEFVMKQPATPARKYSFTVKVDVDTVCPGLIGLKSSPLETAASQDEAPRTGHKFTGS